MMPAALVTVVVVVSMSALIAWQWWLSHRSTEADAQRAHEFAVHEKRVQVDQKTLDDSMAAVKRLEERVKTLEYRPR